MATTATRTAEIFTVRSAYLLQGITTETLSETEHLRIAIKVYAEGGENRLHHHLHEDHSFIVLEGEATFHLGSEDDVHVVGPLQGVMLPRNVDYRFESSGKGNLVMLRVASLDPTIKSTAFYPDGVEKDRRHEPYTKLERIEAPGDGFGPAD